MKIVLPLNVIITLLFVLVADFANAQRWEWAAGAHGLVNNASSHASSIDIDNQGNIYSLVGGSKSIELANTTYAHPIADSLNYMLVTKQQQNGVFEAVIPIYSDGDLFRTYIKADSLNNIYVLGALDGTKLYVSGPQQLVLFDQPNINNQLQKKMFLLKLDNSGALIWAKTGAAVDSTVITDFEVAGIVTAANDIYISGTYRGGAFSFANLEVAETQWPNSFLIKLNQSGNVVWAKKSIGNYGNFLTDITTDGHSIYVAGQYRNSIEFGNATLYVPSHPGDNERIFIFKFDTSGTTLWAKEEGGPYQYSGTYLYGNAPRKIVTDKDGNVYVGGSYQDITGGSGNGVIQRPFLSKYSANTGNLLWTNTDFMPGFPNEINGIIIDSTLNIICSGRYRGNFSAGNTNFPYDPISKSMLLKFQSNNGTVIGAESIGQYNKLNTVSSICMAPDKSFFVISGGYNDTLKLDTLSLINGGWAGAAFWFKYLLGNPTSIRTTKTIKPNLVIYPNPAHSFINLSIDKIQEGELIIRNSVGGIVFRKYWHNKTGSVNISNLPPGWYLLELKFKDLLAQATFVKSN